MSHVDPNKVRRAYNHAEYVEPRRKMIQEWADPLMGRELYKGERGKYNATKHPAQLTPRFTTLLNLHKARKQVSCLVKICL